MHIVPENLKLFYFEDLVLRIGFITIDLGNVWVSVLEIRNSG